MIAYEQFQKIRTKELGFIFLLAGLFSLLIYTINLFLTSAVVFVVSLALLSGGMNLAVYLIRKSGTATIFYLTSSILTINLTDIGIVGWKKVLVFLLAALLFEIIFLIFKVYIYQVPLDVVVGTTISTMTIPLITAFLLSADLASSFPLGLVNLVVLAFSIGLGASVLVFLLWYNLEQTKLTIKLKYYLMR